MKQFELVDAGCPEKVVYYHGVKVGGWMPNTGMFREWGTDKAAMHFQDKRELLIFVIARFGGLKPFVNQPSAALAKARHE